jgi:hypothetical protein
MMGLAYAPFVPEVGPPTQVLTVPPGPIKNDRTECNYLVMFFVIGVVLLGISDSLDN